jgi:dipeptidyl aminopeptidase/acylaminoacyl peptidase
MDVNAWRERFEVPDVWPLALAADQARGLVVTSLDARNYQLFAWDVPERGGGGTERLTALTDEKYGVIDGWLDPAGRHVYYLRDEDGSELGHVVRVPFGGGQVRDVTPTLDPFTLRGFGFSLGGSRLCFNPVNANGFALYAIDIDDDGEPGEPRLLYRDTFETWGALVSATGDLAACWSVARAGGVRHYTLLAVDADTGGVVAELNDGPEAAVVGVTFSPLDGDGRLLARTTRTRFVRPVIWDPRTGDRRDLDVGGLDGEVEPLDWSPDGRRVLLCQPAGRQRLHVYDLDADRLTSLDHEPGTYFFPLADAARFGSAETIVGRQGVAERPPRIVEMDAGSGALRRVLLAENPAPAGRPWRSVTVTSSDGTPVQAWYATPHGPGPYPAILEVHGGPHHAIVETWDPMAQCWLDHGYAWMSVNFRGSTMFGRDFAEQIWGDLGHWELEDMVAARAWLVEQGIARADQVIVTGGSYGGYLTLYALGRRPDLWAGGMGLVVDADFAGSYRDASDALRAAIAGWMRGTPEERPEAYAASSAITYCADVGAPLLVIQGRNDSRCPPKQFEAYERRMRELGKDIEVEWFDAGHMSIGPELWISFQERMLAFAERILG